MNFLKKGLLAVALMTVLSISGYSQTATTQTILSAAVNATQTSITVASATGFSASTQSQNYALFVDGEFMKVNSVSGTTIGVTRGYQNTRGVSHPTAYVVWFGLLGPSTNGIGYPFTSQSPVPGSGCTSTQFGYLPIINVTDGTVWNCLTSTRGGNWIGFGYQQYTSKHPVVNVIDVAYTASLADEFVDYTSLTTTRILTLPAITGIKGKTIVVLNNATGTSAITITPVNGQTIGNAAATTLSLSGAGAVSRLISVVNSTGGYVWATW